MVIYFFIFVMYCIWVMFNVYFFFFVVLVSRMFDGSQYIIDDYCEVYQWFC